MRASEGVVDKVASAVNLHLNLNKIKLDLNLMFSETYKYLYSRHIQANVPPPEKTKERSNKLSRKGSKASINGAK